MNSLNILSGGAAQGLVGSLAPKLKRSNQPRYRRRVRRGRRDGGQLRNGTPTDIIILTAALVAKLADEKLAVAASIADVGLVETALAVASRDPQVKVTDAATLRAAFLAADAIFVPDTKASTAQNSCRRKCWSNWGSRMKSPSG